MIFSILLLPQLLRLPLQMPNHLLHLPVVQPCLQFLGQVRHLRRDRTDLVLPPATVRFRDLLPALVSPSIHPDYQQGRLIGPALGRPVPLLILEHLRIAITHHAVPKRFRPPLNLLAIPLHLPVYLQRPRRLVKRLLPRLTTNSLRCVRRQIRFQGQGPVTVLSGKKSRRNCGGGSTASRSTQAHRGR
jgi:hypothetical protein